MSSARFTGRAGMLPLATFDRRLAKVTGALRIT